MTTADFLLRLRSIIVSGWTREASARDGDGVSVSKYSEDAVCFCLLGGMSQAHLQFSDEEPDVIMAHARAVIALYAATGCDDLVSWNDAVGRTHEEVVAAIDRAIHAQE